tara:strand:+ start:102 stop:881 length:780 start_codon:yes stop_codon:yes gene_type:complete
MIEINKHIPKISIITITKNSEKYVEDCIKSVVEQTYKNYEYIIIDGNSKDRTIEIIKKYEKYISCWKSEDDDGLYDALNKGIKSATGEFIGFLHSDDFFSSSEVIAYIANELKSNEYDFVHSNLKIVDKNDVTKTIRHMKLPNFNLFKLKIGLIPPHPTIYYRRNMHTNYGYYDNTFSIAGDYDMLLRLMMSGNLKYKYLNINSVVMRSGGKSNRGILSKLKINFEILRSARINNFKTNFFYLLIKILFRLREYFFISK